MYSFPFIGLAIGLTGLKMALPGMMAGLKYTGLFHKTILPEKVIWSVHKDIYVEASSLVDGLP